MIDIIWISLTVNCFNLERAIRGRGFIALDTCHFAHSWLVQFGLRSLTQNKTCRVAKLPLVKKPRSKPTHLLEPENSNMNWSIWTWTYLGIKWNRLRATGHWSNQRGNSCLHYSALSSRTQTGFTEPNWCLHK